MDRPVLWGINHLKLATMDIARTRDFYCDILGMEHLPQYDCRNQQFELLAIMVRLRHTETSSTLIEIRLNANQALIQHGLDPITYAVRGRESLERWRRWLENKGVQCSSVQPFQSLSGWCLSALDPDGRVVRIYSDERFERPVEDQTGPA